MTMNEALGLVLALAPGALLGATFFGGLWWTVRRGFSSKRPALLFCGSLLLRTGIAVTGFYFVADGDWRRLLVCLVGFSGARLVVTWLATRMAEPSYPAEAASHAP